MFLCGFIFFSGAFGMEKVEQLKLHCATNDLLDETHLPVTFKEADQNHHFPIATLFNSLNTPGYFHVQLPEEAYTYLSEDKSTLYLSSLLHKEQTISALQKFLYTKNIPDRIIMQVQSSYQPKQFSILGQYFFVLETSELPTLIKERYNIKNLSKAEKRNFYILVPLVCLCSLLLYSNIH